MSRHPLYSEYLALLDDLATEMAQAAPEAAGALIGKGFDPDVERLLEGIAFIASKIDEKRAKGLDDVCQLMADVLFPQYLCSVPACTIVAFDNRLDRPPRQLPRGTELHSAPVGGTPCRFLTAHDTVVGGLALEQVAWERHGTGAALTLRFNGAAWLQEHTLPDHIRLHLHGEPLITRTLYRALLAYQDGLELLDEQDQTLDAKGVSLRPVGYGEEEALLDHPLGCFEGFRLLQEYFTIPDKLMFVDVTNARVAVSRALGPDASRFSLRLRLRVDRDLTLTTHNVRLACAPAVNLFPHSADPIQREPGRMEYRVRPAGPHLHFETCRVVRVTAIGPQGAIDYPLLAELDQPDAEQRFVQLRRSQHSGEQDFYLSLHDAWLGQPDQTLSIELVCSNGKLPTALGLGDIDTVADMPGLGCHNLMPPTAPTVPPLGEELRRRLVEHMVLSQRDLTELGALRTALVLYLPRAATDVRAARTLKAVTTALIDSSSELVQMRRGGVPRLGRRTTLLVDPKSFPVEAESYLFGSVLNEYVALQAALNGYSQLFLQHSETQEAFRWPARIGTQTLS